MENPYIIQFDRLSMKELAKVGGKNASLGEMMGTLKPLGIEVPDGFALTAVAFNDFMASNSLEEALNRELEKLDRKGLSNLAQIGKNCREIISNATLTEPVVSAITPAYENLIKKYGSGISVAVRSSATCEDSPSASFAGQHESFLNVRTLPEVINSVKQCYVSLYNDRAIKYRQDNDIADLQVAQSVGVQLMVRSDLASAGVAFTIEPETGNKNLIYITGAWGLGESVVQGAVNTDEFYVFKQAIEDGKNPIVYTRKGSKDQMIVYSKEGDKSTVWKDTPHSLRDQFVLTPEEASLLGRWCLEIEKHYGVPMDVEWAKDGNSGRLYIVQARPETVQGRTNHVSLKEYVLKTKEQPLVTGKAVGHSIVSGRACIIKSLADSNKVEQGDIIIADITNPDWNALLRKAVCIVTNKGGRTSHASIVARELGIPAVVGTMNAMEKLQDGQIITVSCASGDIGQVFNGKLEWSVTETPFENLHQTKTKPMLILADPQKALIQAALPNEGVGLLRMEFIITNSVQVHPMALVNFDSTAWSPEKNQIEALTRQYRDKKKFFVDTLAQAIGLVATAFYPKEVIVRMSDFKTNEYAKLLGGQRYEPTEENPMLGFRGASRYYNEKYREGFGLECLAIQKVRDEMGLTNVKVMIPFCRTPEEGQKVLDVMNDFGLERGRNDLEVYVMAEIPSNILLAREFASLFDGFSIGSNDLTQLTLGLDRDSAIVSDLFDERNQAVTSLIRRLITVAHEEGKKVGLCGQAPSDYPEFAHFLVGCGIDSISFNPDALVHGIENIITAENNTVLYPYLRRSLEEEKQY